MILLYQIFLFVYKAGVYIVSLGSDKARLWIKGRVNVFSKLKKSLPIERRKTVWMHCASLGEFEQGRPVLKMIKELDPEMDIVITFFSPSGYEVIKNSKEFDKIFYLPMDSFIHAKRWLKILKPDLVLWVKYEYWFYYLKEINRKEIPLLLISGVFNADQVFFKWYGGLYKKMLGYFTHFFLQNTASKDQLQKLISPEKISVSGDTRCDRVINIVNNFSPVDGIAQFCGDSHVIVAGSTWEDDEALFVHYVRMHPELKFIIAPHEVDSQNVLGIKKQFEGSVLYSELKNKSQQGTMGEMTVQDSNCLIINNIGILSRLYHYATIAYVGGGFGDNGLHNILEAAVYGKPVIFGPYLYKNFEAEELINCRGAISVESAVEMEKVLDDLLQNQSDLALRGEAAKNYVYENAGAAEKIIDFIKEINVI
ncbi:MAG: glycosyltransferase N-terminal domain-containing protein [Ginsengibacter sp.]